MIIFNFLLLFVVLVEWCVCFYKCPNNTLPFDFNPCDPSKRSQCPSGFTCRLAQNIETGSTMELCCESGLMTITEWLQEKKIHPDVLKKQPQQILKSVKLAPINSNVTIPDIHIGDEIVTLSFASFEIGIIEKIELSDPQVDGSFIHVLTIIDPTKEPFGFYLNYNIRSNGNGLIDVTGLSKFASFIDNRTSVATSDSYRSEYLILVYQTLFPLELGDVSTIMADCRNAGCLLDESPLARQLNQPIASSVFYITTRNTIFATSGRAIPQKDEEKDDNSASVDARNVVLVLIVSIVLY